MYTLYERYPSIEGELVFAAGVSNESLFGTSVRISEDSRGPHNNTSKLYFNNFSL